MPSNRKTAWLAALLGLLLLGMGTEAKALPQDYSPYAPYCAIQEFCSETDALQAAQEDRAWPEPLPENEIPGKRDMSSSTYRNPEGGFIGVYYTGPVHYLDGQGDWQDINTEITASDLPGFDYANLTNNFKTYFKERPDGFFLRYQVGEAWVEFRLLPIPGLGASHEAKASVEHNSLVYKNLYDGIDVKFTLGNADLVPEWIVKDRETAAKIERIPLEIRYQGVRPVPEIGEDERKIEKVDFVSVDGNTLFFFPRPKMYEAENKLKLIRDMRFEIRQEGGKYFVTKVLEKKARAWLQQPFRNYPIAIDVTASHNGTSADGYLVYTGTLSCGDPGSATSANTTDTIGYAGVTDTSDEFGTQYDFYRTYLTFNTVNIPDSATVDGSSLSYVLSADVDAFGHTIYGTGTCWGGSLTTADWTACTTSLGTTSDGSGTKTLHTGASAPILTGATQFRLISSNETSCSGRFADQIAVSEFTGTSNDPVLKVYYNTVPDAPSNLVQVASSCTGSTISAGGWSTSSTICFTADVNDDDGESQALVVDVNAVGTVDANTDDNSGANTASGSTASVIVSGYSDGNYHWHVRGKDTNGEYGSWVCYGTCVSSSMDFGVDTTAPSLSITSPSAGQSLSSDFNVVLSESDAKSGMSICDYNVTSNSVVTKSTTARTCTSNILITNANGTGDCRDAGTNKCTIWVDVNDNAGNKSYASVSVSPSYGQTVTIDVNNTPMAFTLKPNEPDQNGDSNLPFLITNTGNTAIDVSLDAQLLSWGGTTGGSDRNFFQFIADNNEASSCTTFDQTGWTGFWITDQTGTNKGLCQGLSSTVSTNQINVGIRILAPADEPDTTSLSSTITFYIAQDTTGANDALITYP